MASIEVTAYDTRLAGWNFSWNLTEKEFSDFKERLDDDLKGIGDKSDKILGNAKIGKYGIQIEYIGSDPDNPIDLTFYRLAETDRYANKNDWTTANDSEKYWMSLTADEVRGADFDTFKERIEDKIYKFIMTQTDYGRSPDGARMLKEDVLCPIPPQTDEPTIEELHKYFDRFKLAVKDGTATLTTAGKETIDLGHEFVKELGTNNELWFGFSYKGKTYDLDVYTGEEFGTEEGQWNANVYRVSSNGGTLTDELTYSSEVSVERVIDLVQAPAKDVHAPAEKKTSEEKNDMNMNELEEYARRTATQKAALEGEIEKNKRSLETKRKELVKDAKEFLRSLHTACLKIFPEGNAPIIWPFGSDSENPELYAEVLPGKTDPSNAKPFEIPNGVSVGIYKDGDVNVTLVYSETPRFNKQIIIYKEDIRLRKYDTFIDDAFYEGELSDEELKWIVDNKDVIKEAFSLSVKKRLDLSLKETKREKEETDRRVRNMESKPPAATKSKAPPAAQKAQTNPTFDKEDAIDYLRGWIEHAELEGIPEGRRRENAQAFLDQIEKNMKQEAARPATTPKKERTPMTEKTYGKMKSNVEWMRTYICGSPTDGQQVKDSMFLLNVMDKLIDKKWERERPQENTKPVPIKKKEPDCGYER